MHLNFDLKRKRWTCTDHHGDQWRAFTAPKIRLLLAVRGHTRADVTEMMTAARIAAKKGT